MPLKRVVLVQPPALQCEDGYSSITQPPLGMAYLAAYARKAGFTVDVVDGVGSALEKVHPWPHSPGIVIQGLALDEVAARIPEDADVIGFSCMFTHAWPMVRELMLKVRKARPRAFLIGGGEHCTAMYETVLKDGRLDLVVCGEGEETFVEVLGKLAGGDRDFSKTEGVAYLDADGSAVKTPRRARIREPDKLPYPDWEALDIETYMKSHTFMGPSAAAARSIPMLATRGCPYACTFCASPNMWTRMYRTRDPRKVVDEMEHWVKRYGANDFQFQDLTAIVRKEWIVEFCKELIARRLGITWQIPVGTRSEAIDKEVTDLLVESGCLHITYAPESGSERILKAVDKKVHLGCLEDSARAALESGMRVCLFIIVGFPQEKPEDIARTFRFVRRMARIGVHEIAVSTFVPLPGTALFEETSRLNPIEVNDDYCYWMAGSTRLLHVKSWNPYLSDSRLRRLKLLGLAHFWGMSVATHPKRGWDLLRALATSDQKTKSDRALHEFMLKLKRRLKGGAGSAQAP